MALMIKSNVKAMHDLGYKGQGRKGVIWDTRNNPTFPIHPETVEDVGLQVAPEAESKVIVFSDLISGIRESLEYAEGETIAVNISMTGIQVDLSREFYLAWQKKENLELLDRFFNQCYIISASGNSGVEEYKYPASTEYYKDKCLAVGACYDAGDTVKMNGYSTWNDRIDIANFSGIKLSKDITYNGVTAYAGDIMEGTSYSAPYTWGEVILFQQMFFEKYGREATIKEINKYMYSICVDIDGDKDGYGYPVMKELSEVVKEDVYIFTQNEADYTVNGEVHTIIGYDDPNDELPAPEVDVPIIDGVTMLPSRIMSNIINDVLNDGKMIIGSDIEWNSVTKEVTWTLSCL